MAVTDAAMLAVKASDSKKDVKSDTPRTTAVVHAFLKLGTIDYAMPRAFARFEDERRVTLLALFLFLLLRAALSGEEK